MAKLKTVQRNVKDQPKKIKDQGVIGKVVKKKTLMLTQKKKESIVEDIISKKDELEDKVTLKKNKIKLNLKEKPKSKADSKKNKSSKLVLVSNTEKTKSKGVTKKDKKNAKSFPVSRDQQEPEVISKKKKNKDKPTADLKKKKIKTTVVSKKNKKAIKKLPISKEEKNKTKVASKKNKNKSKHTLVPEGEAIVSKILSKKEKMKLKKVLAPRMEKNTSEVTSKKSKDKSKVQVASREEKNALKTISRKAKRKAEQKENTKPEVAFKKTKISKDVVTKKNKNILEEPILEIQAKDVQDFITSKKTKDSLKRKNLENYVKALLKVVDTGEQKRRNLLSSEKPPIFLTITCVKIPKAPLHQMRFVLPHSFVAPTDDVALFVRDLKKGRRRDFDESIHHFEDLLQKHGCNRITAVIPINQVKTEYRQFEMIRRLLGTYDYFLCDGRIAGHLAHLLGKTFRENRSLPTSIHMEKKDLKEEIDTALKKTSLQIHSNGDTYVTQFASCWMSVDEITDNLLSVIQELKKNFPGGWENIRCLRIKSPLSLAIPIYMTLKNKNEVEVPVVEPKRPKAYKSVEGELSTFTSNVRVTVAPDGTVDVLKLGNEDSEENGENLDAIEEEVENENKVGENGVNDEDEYEDVDEEEQDDKDDEEDDDDEDDNESDV